VHREELMECLWPGAPYARARNRLNVSIHGLRRSLRARAVRDLVVFDKESYCLNADIPIWFDVDEFEERTRRGRRHHDAGHTEAAMSEFRRAVALYAGDLFEDDKDCDWAESTRRRLRAYRRELLDALADEALRTGDLRACLQWSEMLLDAEPWHENAHARLMRVHARRGQSQLAIRQFVECTRVLRAEVEAMPSRPIIDLYEQIKRGVSV
jgi:DNA-binding SARP family transcriptional activator